MSNMENHRRVAGHIWRYYKLREIVKKRQVRYGLDIMVTAKGTLVNTILQGKVGVK